MQVFWNITKEKDWKLEEVQQEKRDTHHLGYSRVSHHSGQLRPLIPSQSHVESLKDKRGDGSQQASLSIPLPSSHRSCMCECQMGSSRLPKQLFQRSPEVVKGIPICHLKIGYLT